MSAHHPSPAARRLAAEIARRIGAEVETSRRGLSLSVAQVAGSAIVAPSTVSRIIRGDPGVHIDTLCAVARAVGLRISVKAYPDAGPSLRDTGQLRIAEFLIGQAHASLRSALELPVGDPFGRATDLVLFGADEIIAVEIERGVADLQAPLRSATVKRDALQERHARPVRLVLAVEDTTRNRRMIAPHAALLATSLPGTSSRFFRAIRAGRPLGCDALVWVRPWRAIVTERSEHSSR